MNIDVNALQALPEIASSSADLRPKKCNKTKAKCIGPTCVITVVQVGGDDE